MSDVLAIVGPADSDAALVEEIAFLRPRRVTVLVQDAALGGDWALDESEQARALRDRLAELLHEIELRTSAAVIGLVGDSNQLLGWRFDHVVEAPVPVAA